MNFRTYRCALLLFAILLAMALAGQLQKSPNPKTEVLAVVDALNEAGLHRDVNKLRSLYSPQYFHTDPDGSLMQLADVLASYQKPSPFKFESSSADERRVLLAGDSAVVNERLSLHGRKNGDPFVSRYRVTYVLVRGTQGWKVINSHASLLGIETPGK